MTMFNKEIINISKHLITAIEYYDISGLEDYEIKQVDTFLKEYPNACFEYGEDESFDLCKISYARTDCIELTINTPKDK